MPVNRTCPICETGEQHAIPYCGRSTLPVQPVICKSCGLVFINPMYTNAEKDAVSTCPRALHRPVRFGRPIQRAHQRELRKARRFIEFVRPYLKPGDQALVHLLMGVVIRRSPICGLVINGRQRSFARCHIISFPSGRP